MNCATTSQEDKGFNSKLVRLEVGNDVGPSWIVSIANWCDYEANMIVARLTISISFNSKLVRLEDGNHTRTCEAMAPVATFQFQTGSIKSQAFARLLPLQKCALFQFQTGAIRSMHSPVENEKL